jgi:hypothetical protein
LFAQARTLAGAVAEARDLDQKYIPAQLTALGPVHAWSHFWLEDSRALITAAA